MGLFWIVWFAGGFGDWVPRVSVVGGHSFAGHLILALVFLRGFYFAGGLGARLSSWGFWDFPDIY